MKKVLVTGAAGSIGKWVLHYLLQEENYEITALDIKSKEVAKNMKKFAKKINIIYGDVENQDLIDALIKEHDYVIHLAGVKPPLCNLSPTFNKEIDYKGLENIIKSISFFNPKCFFIFPSTTNMYEKSEKDISLNSPLKYEEDDYYSDSKEKCENLIQEKLKNYVIFRSPLVLEENLYNIYQYKKNESIEVVTNSDFAYALVSAIKNKKEINTKIKIISGGTGCRINTTELMIKYLDTFGYSFSWLWYNLSNNYKYHGNIFKEDKDTLELLNYQNESIDSYFIRLQRTGNIKRKHRFIANLLKKKLERMIKK